MTMGLAAPLALMDDRHRQVPWRRRGTKGAPRQRIWLVRPERLARGQNRPEEGA